MVLLCCLKIEFHIWLFILNKFPTKDFLYRKGMLPGNNLNCSFSKREIETSTHILLYSDMV